jgi:hypothetical protein
VSLGSPLRFMSFGILGPKISASNKPMFKPEFRSATARLVETVDFPTPPLQEETSRIFLTFGSICFTGSLVLGALKFGRPYSKFLASNRVSNLPVKVEFENVKVSLVWDLPRDSGESSKTLR